MKYVPKIVFDELDDIKLEDNLFSDAEAFKKMTLYSKKGRDKGFLLRF